MDVLINVVQEFPDRVMAISGQAWQCHTLTTYYRMPEPEVIEVTRGHPLHPSHTFYEKMPLGDVNVTCLWMGYYYMYLQHHNKPEAAEQLLSHPQVMWNPDLIFDTLIRTNVPEPNVNFVVHGVEVMRSIMLYQMQCSGSPFVEALDKELAGKKDPENIEFRVYNSNKEMIFTSGWAYGQWREPVRGFNCYAEILKEMVHSIVTEEPVPNPLFPQISTDFNLYLPYQKKSLFVLSDSQGKFIDNIVGGKVISVSGGDFGHMVKVHNREDLNFRAYPWVYLYCGTNCRAKSRYAQTQQEFDWRNLRDILVREAAARGNETIVFCTSFEHPYVDVSPGLANRIERELHGTGVQCINWQRIGNPFLDPDGQPAAGLYDTFKKRTAYARDAEIHLNHAGLSLLWKTWSTYIPDLKFLPMTLSGKPLTIPKWLLEEPPDLPPLQGQSQQVSSGLTHISVGDSRTPAGDRPTFDARRDAVVTHTSVGGDSSRPSTSRGYRRDAEADSEVTLLSQGGHASASRKRAGSSDYEGELRVSMQRPRDGSECRLTYDKEGRYFSNNYYRR